jgi:methylenetetrahydrofolate dehydrogenase (NADP+)/methenyltetrahydrofolate cyclohydrolase
MSLLRAYHIETTGQHVVILGRSLIVGKPLAILLEGRDSNATVTLCHSKSENLETICRSAKIIISAVGQPNLVIASMVSSGSIVIDVGQNHVADISSPNGVRLCGDVDFDSVAPKCSYITTVPGGVGPMTIAMLMQNVIKAYKFHHSCRQRSQAMTAANKLSYFS